MLCPQCSTENRLGAVFCRSCGLKLDIESITSESFEEKTGVRFKEGMKMSKIIGLAILGLVILGLAAVIFFVSRVPDIERTATTDKAINSFNNKKKWAEFYKAGDYKSDVPFTEAEINSYLIEKFSESDAKIVLADLKEIDIDLKSGNKVEARFFGEMLSRRILFRVTGRVDLVSGALKFEPESAKIGQLPIPGILIKPIFKKAIVAGDEDLELLKKFSSLRIEDDKVIAKIEGTRRYTRK